MIKGLLTGVGLAALVASAPIGAWAQDSDKADVVSDLVITGSLDGGVKRELLGGSATVLSSDALEQRGVTLVADVLRDVPGVAVSRSGCLGCLTQIRIRGAEGNHTLVLVDGINLASAVNREVDLSTLASEDGARVEVLRGQQSALYGSEAIGGVIQYFTPDGRTSPGMRIRAEYGTLNTMGGQIQAGGANDQGDIIVTLSGISTDGEPNTRGGSRDLGYWNYGLSAKAHYAFSDNLRLLAVVRANKNRGDFNSATDASGMLIDSSGDFGKAENTVGKVELQADMMDHRWTHSLAIQGGHFTSSSFSFGSSFDTKGDRVKGVYVTALTFGDDHIRQKLTGSIDYQEENFSQSFDTVERALNTTGFVGVYDVVIDDKTALGASVRNDSNDLFSDFTSYRVQATHSFDSGTRIRAAAGTGIQYPTQFELFGFSGTFKANPNLTPEKSEGWEVGVEQSFMDKAVLIGATYFSSELTDKISSTGFPVTTPINLTGTAHQKGVETFAEFRLDNGFMIDAAYTYLDSTDGVPPKRTVRRAQSIASANLNWASDDDVIRLNFNVRYNGDQDDNRFPFGPPFVVPVVVPAFTVFNARAEYKLNDKVSFFARADNLFDETYEEVWSYVAPGRMLSFGIKAKM